MKVNLFSLLSVCLPTALSSSPLVAQTVSFVLVEDYGDAYQVEGTVTNDTSAALNSWLVRMTLPGTIGNNWRCVLEPTESTPANRQYGLSNESYNGDIEPGASEIFNFIVNSSQPFAQPAAASVVPNWEPRVDPVFRVADVVARENDDNTGTASFTVTLSPASEVAVAVSYATRDGNATAPGDYSATSGILNFAAGETSKSVVVALVGDEVEELTERFELVLSNANVALAKAVATCTILDNDGDSSGQGRPQTGLYNYAEVLQKSLWFYDAQRAGDLPEGFRVPWRGDAALNDGSDVGLDLSGGFFDAGDHVKFGFPMAFSLTMLSWGAIEYPLAYQETGQFDALRQNLKWGSDYFLKCHQRNADGSTAAFYGQVGDGDLDHAYWGTAETMTMPRPAFAIDADNPGSDLAAETAASLAATAMLFRSDQPAYAAELLENAEALYAFAESYRGKYSDSITDADSFYRSSNFQDELVWGALWLYRATNDASYLTKAKAEYAQLIAPGAPTGWTLSWDDKTYGCFILLSMLDGAQSYRNHAESWLNNWMSDGSVRYTPGGMASIAQWGNLRYSSNTSFCALVYADRVNDPGDRYSTFALNQIHYALGENPDGRSYVCGFGVNPPVNPHHRNSHASTTNNIARPTQNIHVLYGALVGGPGSNDDYVDDRTDFFRNEVAMDYNAGFTGAIARLYQEYGGVTLPELSSTSPPLTPEEPSEPSEPTPPEEEPTEPLPPVQSPPGVPQSGIPFDVTPASRLAADSALYDWSGSGYRGTGIIPGDAERVHTIDATTFGVIGDDGLDDSVALQAAIDSASSLERDFDNLAVITLPAGQIDIGKQINLHVSYLILKGAGSDPQAETSTRIIFKPDTDTRYDIVTASGNLPDFDAMSHSGSDLDWIWPGRGLFKVQTLAVEDSYTEDAATAPENRKDIFQGSINFHWKAGLPVLQNGGLVAPAGATVIPLDSSIPNRKITPLVAGMNVVIKASDTNNMYLEQEVASQYWRPLYMKMQMFRLVAVDQAARTITLDKPLEFDLYADSVSDGSAPLSNSPRESKVVPVQNVVGVGIEDLYLTLPLDGLPRNGGGTYRISPEQATYDYTNLAPEYALHGIVFKWASDCWVRNIRTFMTGSHAIVTEEARHLQIEDSVFEGSWNKGAGGNGYFRFSRVWDSLVQGNTLHNIRHLTLQWSASGNVVSGNSLNCDINFHGGWERFNLVENNVANVPRGHAPNPSENWYPLWWATGPKAGKWAGSSGPRNILFRNTFRKQIATDGPFLPYERYTSEELPAGTVTQMGWDRETTEGTQWQHLTDGSDYLADWSGSETSDFASGDNLGVNNRLVRNAASLFLQPYNHNYQSWATHYFGRAAGRGAGAAPSGDFDNDGRNNFEEYAFAGDPLTADRNPITIQKAGNLIQLDIVRNHNASDIDWQLMTSESLTAWIPSSADETEIASDLFSLEVRYLSPIKQTSTTEFFQMRATPINGTN